jgi:hypothetical protein
MNLLFHAEGHSRLAVDSLPFQQGTFEHQLSEPPRESFYAATGWKKIRNEAEIVPRYPIAFIRGRVSDTANGKPVGNARVVLRANPYSNGAAGNADMQGLFTLRVRADQFEKVSDLAVLALHPDYLPDFAIAAENRKGGPLQTIDNVNVKLMRAVIISGRVTDENTGLAPLPDRDIKLQADYPGSKELWKTKVGGETEYVSVKDGTFLIKTGIGKNRLNMLDKGFCYDIRADQRELDVEPGGLPNFVLVLVRRGCRREAYPMTP